MKPLHDVILRPVVTEKSHRLQEQNKYIFLVARGANKVEVRRAVERAFGVTVVDVNIAKSRGRLKRYGMRRYRSPDEKKAVVRVKTGEKIEIFPGV
jgi:large subunit ribosomal protein L23